MKRSMAAIAAALWLVLVGTGCTTLLLTGEESAESPAAPSSATARPTEEPAAASSEASAAPTASPTAEPTSTAAPAVETLVGVYRREQVEYQGETLTYTVPEILLDTPGAVEINAEIQAQWDPAVDYALETAEAYYPFYGHIGYDAWITDGLLTVTMDMRHDEAGNGVSAYTLDLANGEALDTAAVVARAGMAEDAFFEAVRACMEAEFYATQTESFELGDKTRPLDETLSEENVRQSGAYLDRDGQLQAVCTIYTVFAVNTRYTAVLEIDPTATP